MLPVIVGDVLAKADSHSAMKLTKLLPVVHADRLLNFTSRRKAVNPVASAAGPENR